MPARTLRRVLIANRGEIAIRIARAAHGLGIETVAVAPAADEHSLHTRVTTTARRLHEGRAGHGPSDGIAAYLDIAELLRIAAEEGCDSVHPGYGFLAEHAGFASACRDAGLTFVGPAPELLALFGDKVRARELARSLGVPVAAGSSEPAATPEDAVAVAESLGWPVMLKAAAGGGGRGMREVLGADAMAEAFARASGEAAAAFGDGRLFVERLMPHPRHLEVQILGDGTGALVHLHERDCSVQLRHQKVVEVAPAVTLDDSVRARVLADAVAIGTAVGYSNAGTVEFLVVPETGEHVFIECNPRIQVEHTVTEQVTGIDLVAAQFRIAAGETLADLGLESQASVPSPRGVAVQARVVVTGPGTITAHQAPTGAGVRVDGSGYTGYAPSPQFDPLLAKVIAAGPTLGAALDRADAALAEFLVDGVPTNLDGLRAILRHESVRRGDARTTLLAEHPHLAEPPTGDAPASPARAFLAEQARALGHGAVPAAGGAAERARRHLPVLDATDRQAAAVCPTASAVVEVCVAVGDHVALGTALVVLSAMKMETVVAAPCAGVVTALLPLVPGDLVDAGAVVAVLAPDDQRADGSGSAGHPWSDVLDQVAALHGIAAARFASGSTDPGVVRQRSRGKLTCRERIDLLLDAGSFREVGSVAGFASLDADGTVTAFTPANHVGGSGRIDSRPVIVCADDFTSRGGHADGAIGGKSMHLDRLSIQLRVPSVRLLDGSSGGGSVAAMVPEQKGDGEATAKESHGAITAGRPRVSGGGGSFLPGHLGSTDYTTQLATVPVVNVLLGSVVGIGAAKAVLGHFSVMVRDVAQLFVAGPPVVRHAMGTTSRRRTSAAGTSTAATGRSTTWPRPSRRRST